MRLQTKLTLAFAAVALLPIVLLGAVARLWVENRARGEYRETLSAAEAETEQEYKRLSEQVVRSAQNLARAEDPLMSSVLIELSRGTLDEDRARELQSQTVTEMRARGLDVLELASDKGEVLACGHFPARVGESDRDALERHRHAPGRPLLLRLPLMNHGAAVESLALIVANQVEGVAPSSAGPVRVWVSSGMTVGRAFLERLRFPARLLMGDREVARVDSFPIGAAAALRRSIDLYDAEGIAIARVEVAVSNDELRRTLAWIGYATFALSLFGVAMSLLLGALIAHRITRPISQLTDGARAVARGDLAVRVPVRGNDELGELGRTFNSMAEDLSQARERLVRVERVAAWREIARRIAHEIKNPLTPIQMAIETMARARRGQTQADFGKLFDESAPAILDEVARLKHIVSEFAGFARMPKPHFESCSLNEIAESALALYKNGASVPVESALEPSLPHAKVDRDQITQVILNLVENARDAAGEHGNVRITTRSTENGLEVEVSDTGPGLSDEARAQIFTPYFTTKEKGTGLGLAIVQRIVTDHGGEVRVGGVEGQGAVFTIRLPRA